MTNLYFKIDTEKLNEVTSIINANTDPKVTEEMIEQHTCADWEEGDEHQEWINSADAQEIADWIGSHYDNQFEQMHSAGRLTGHESLPSE